MNKLLIVTLSASIMMSATVHAAPKYEFSSLNDITGDHSVRTFILDINDNGSVVVHGNTEFIFAGGNRIEFGGKFLPTAINNSNHAGGFDAIGAAFWDGTSITNVGTLGGIKSGVLDINNLDQMVGSSTTARNGGIYQMHATLWDHGKIVDLGVLKGGFTSFATAINDQGQIIGQSQTKTNDHPFIWQNGVMTDLSPTLDSVYDINNKGQVLGTSAGHVVLWENGSAKDLFTVNAPFSSMNFNDSGVIAGTINDLNQTPFIFENGQLTYLNDVIDGDWQLFGANHINNNGIITGFAENTVTGEQTAYILTPVPEPTTYAMLLTGLGLMGFLWIRKRR